MRRHIDLALTVQQSTDMSLRYAAVQLCAHLTRFFSDGSIRHTFPTAQRLVIDREPHVENDNQ